jgi:hypothetical protein
MSTTTHQNVKVTEYRESDGMALGVTGTCPTCGTEWDAVCTTAERLATAECGTCFSARHAAEAKAKFDARMAARTEADIAAEDARREERRQQAIRANRADAQQFVSEARRAGYRPTGDDDFDRDVLRDDY